MDALSLTYYPLQYNFDPKDPSVVSGDFDVMTSTTQGQLLLIQEIGYPSGFLPPTNNGSEQLQSTFVKNIFLSLAKHKTEIVWFSYFLLNDISPSVCNSLSEYYHLPGDAGFIEYLCTLGLCRYANGTAKLGFGQFLESLREFKAGNLTSQSSTNGNSRHVAPKLSILFLLVWVLCVLFVRAEKRAP